MRESGRQLIYSLVAFAIIFTIFLGSVYMVLISPLEKKTVDCYDVYHNKIIDAKCTQEQINNIWPGVAMISFLVLIMVTIGLTIDFLYFITNTQEMKGGLKPNGIKTN